MSNTEHSVVYNVDVKVKKIETISGKEDKLKSCWICVEESKRTLQYQFKNEVVAYDTLGDDERVRTTEEGMMERKRERGRTNYIINKSRLVQTTQRQCNCENINLRIDDNNRKKQCKKHNLNP